MQMVTNPTHFVCGSESMLDLAFVLQPEKVKFVEQFPVCGISNHDAISLIYSLKRPKFSPKDYTFRDIKNIDFENLKAYTQMYVMEDLFKSNDISFKVDLLNSAITGTLDLFAPTKTIRFSKPKAEWMDDMILSEIKNRDKI